MNELVFRFFYGLTGSSPIFDRLVIFTASYLGWLFLGLAVIVLVWRGREEAAPAERLSFVVLTTLGSWLIGVLIKWFWPLARPFARLNEVVPLVAFNEPASFPSLHATLFFTLGLTIYAIDPRLGGWAWLVASLIGLARVTAGVHWPFDILGGLVLALVASSLGLFVVRLINPGFGRRIQS